MDKAKASQILSGIAGTRFLTPLTRIGGTDDGGYWIPTGFKPEVVISPGVGNQVALELHYLGIGARVYAIDTEIPDKLAQHPNCVTIPKLLRSNFLVSEDSLSLDSIVALEDPGQSILVQMDIEGAEMEVLLSTEVSTLRSISILVMEVHNLENFLTKVHLPILETFFGKIHSTHILVHTEQNLSSREIKIGELRFHSHLELTFMRKDLYARSSIIN